MVRKCIVCGPCTPLAMTAFVVLILVLCPSGSASGSEKREEDPEKLTESIVKAKKRNEAVFVAAVNEIIKKREDATDKELYDKDKLECWGLGEAILVAKILGDAYEKFTRDTDKLTGAGKEFYLSTVIQQLYEHGKLMDVCREWANKQHEYWAEDLRLIADFRKNELHGKTGPCYDTVTAKLDGMQRWVEFQDSLLDEHMEELAEKFDDMCKKHVGSRSDEKRKGKLAYWDDQLHQAVDRFKESKTGQNACDVVIAFDKMFEVFTDTDFMSMQRDVLVLVDALILYGDWMEKDRHRTLKKGLKELRKELKRCLRP